MLPKLLTLNIWNTDLVMTNNLDTGTQNQYEKGNP